MSEKALRKYLTGILTGHVVHIESHATAVGVPDTNYAAEGKESWIELKHAFGKKPFKIRPAQKTWFTRRGRTGARNLWLLWRHEMDGQTSHGIIHMVGDRVDAVFRDTSVSFWRYASVQTWGPEIDPNELNKIMRMA